MCLTTLVMAKSSHKAADGAHVMSYAAQDPDVDAIWRLANKERIGVVHFQEAAPLAFQQGTISPYNTQNTAHYRYEQRSTCSVCCC